MSAVRNYALVTAAYWAFTVTDGALRMLVLLHFHELGYDPIALAFLFVFYEFFGIITNLFGGYAAARFGLKVTLVGGLGLQVFALTALALVDPGWPVALSVSYVMAAQALSGIAKDLTKLSAKSSIKALVPEGAESALFKWVAALTGSKNALKGVGFFVGGVLLSNLGFARGLEVMAGALVVVLVATLLSLPADVGHTKAKPKFKGLLSKNHEVNVLSAARFFLFGARDIWFVVGVPVFLSVRFGWSFTEVGSFLAAWVIGYGAVQAIAPAIVGRFTNGQAPDRRAATTLGFALAIVLATVAVGLSLGWPPRSLLLGGLGLFGAIFAVNSSVHSYLILAYSDGDKVAMNVGFYYMANAGGRLAGTLLSGVLYGSFGVAGCLWGSVAFALTTALLSLLLPVRRASLHISNAETDAGD